MERNRIKCGNYWPQQPEDCNQYGGFVVENIEQNVGKDFTVNEFTIANLEVCMLVLYKLAWNYFKNLLSFSSSEIVKIGSVTLELSCTVLCRCNSVLASSVLCWFHDVLSQ